jgi:hypothetical protein
MGLKDGDEFGVPDNYLNPKSFATFPKNSLPLRSLLAELSSRRGKTSQLASRRSDII